MQIRRLGVWFDREMSVAVSFIGAALGLPLSVKKACHTTRAYSAGRNQDDWLTPGNPATRVDLTPDKY